MADPLKLYDCCPFSDGAAAVVLASEDVARRTRKPVWVLGSAQAGRRHVPPRQADLARAVATERAAAAAYRQAGMGPRDVDVVELHDCFTIAEIVATEGLGLFEPGTGGIAAEKGETSLGGRIPVNTSGGPQGQGPPDRRDGRGADRRDRDPAPRRGRARARSRSRGRAHPHARREHGDGAGQPVRPGPAVSDAGRPTSGAAGSIADARVLRRRARGAARRPALRGCGALAVPPEGRLPRLPGRQLGAVDRSAGDGEVASYTVIRVPPAQLAAEAPYVGSSSSAWPRACRSWAG